MGALEGLISEDVFKFVTALFFSLATITATARTAIRWHLNRKFQADDFFLFFALICSIASAGLLYKVLPTIYLSASLNTEAISAQKLVTLASTANWFRKRYQAYFIISWAAVFSVKAAFLMFFKRLVDRMGWISVYWRVTAGFTAVSFIYCVINGFIACPLEGTAAIACSRGRLFPRATALTILATTLDILTELMIVAIPIWVIHNYRRSSRQKLGMGIFLCLNACQAIFAIIRMAGIRSRFTLDHTWNDFWQQIEVSIAISMVSLTAFRSFFVAERARARRYRTPSSDRKWYSTPIKVLTGSSGSRTTRDDDEELDVLPRVPGATLTGMRTFIRREGREADSTMDLESRWEPEPITEDVESLASRRRYENRMLVP